VIELIVYGIASCLDLDSYLLNLLKVIVETNVFVAIIENFFEYEWNNLYQKVFEQILNLIAYKSSPHELIENVTFYLKIIGFSNMQIPRQLSRTSPKTKVFFPVIKINLT
jgi:hypothetical protein